MAGMKHPEQARGRNRSRWRGQGDQWETPPEFFAVLDAEFNFTLDPCATHESAKCERHYTEAEDGLAQDWRGETVFMNPPYGRASVAAWMRKAAAEIARGAVVVALVPASMDADWWHEIVLPLGAVRPIRGRLPFRSGPDRPDGSRQWNSPFTAVCVVVLGAPGCAPIAYEVTQKRGVPTVTQKPTRAAP